MYWVSHVTTDQNQQSALLALEEFLNDETDEIQEIVHISPQYALEEPTPLSEWTELSEPIAFVVVLRIKR